MIAADRPRTVGVLRQDHLALMMQWRELADDGVRARKAADLRQCVKEAGQDILDRTERDEAQGIIDYWASAISSLPGESYPPILTLDAYRGESARRAGDSARRVFDALETEEERRVARNLFEDLLYLDADGRIQRGAPRSRAVLQQSIGSQSLDSVLERFVETGAIARLAADTADADRFEASDARVVEDWPALRPWLEERRAYYTRRSHLMAQAERWRAAGRDPALLARGKEAGKIDRFLNETDLLDEFIEASKRASRLGLIVRTGLAAVVLALCLVLALRLNVQFQGWADTVESIEAQEKRLSVAIRAAAPAEAEETVLSREAGTLARLAADSDAAQQGAARYMWIGDERTTNLRDPGSGARVFPGEVRRGRRYQVTAHIALRSSLPGAPNRSGPLVGAVKPGAVVLALAEAELWPPSGQYWLRVDPPDVVYIQFSAGDPSPLRNHLARAGFDVPPAERLDSADGLNEVRYCRETDRAAAERVAELVSAVRRTSTPSRWIGENRACQQVSAPGVIEVWTANPGPQSAAGAN
ncbi:MAG: hypothetical protein SWI22_03215 [Pseudomonadota bacterium]|nr:hypothetical protein [Pseudomonadota bacterium]